MMLLELHALAENGAYWKPWCLTIFTRANVLSLLLMVTEPISERASERSDGA